MNEGKKYDIAVVLSAAGCESIDELEMPFEEIKFESTYINDREYDLLFDLFGEFNKAFDIIIDSYEEEEIPASGISSAIELTVKFLTSSAGERRRAAQKLLTALMRAKEISAPILLAF